MKRIGFFDWRAPGRRHRRIYFSQRRHDSTPVSANAVVEVAADAQRDLSRVPMRVDASF